MLISENDIFALASVMHVLQKTLRCILDSGDAKQQYPKACQQPNEL